MSAFMDMINFVYNLSYIVISLQQLHIKIGVKMKCHKFLSSPKIFSF